jgi:carboxyl-terminal processing protease
MRALALKSREESNQTHVSLNESVRTAERQREEQWRLDLENALRKAKGEEPLESYEDLEEANAARDDDEEEDPSDDAMLRESGQILVDYMQLTRQIALAEHRTEPDVALQ